MRNKFQILTKTIDNNFVVLLVMETKVDDSFPSNQFLFNGYR